MTLSLWKAGDPSSLIRRMSSSRSTSKPMGTSSTSMPSSRKTQRGSRSSGEIKFKVISKHINCHWHLDNAFDWILFHSKAIHIYCVNIFKSLCGLNGLLGSISNVKPLQLNIKKARFHIKLSIVIELSVYCIKYLTLSQGDTDISSYYIC